MTARRAAAGGAARGKPGSDRADGTGGVAWRDVGVFLLLTFGLTWGAVFPALAGGMRFDTLAAPSMALLSGIMFVPALSALITRRLITREGFATAGLRWGPWKPYLAVWLGVPLLFGAVYLLSAALGLGHFDPSGEAALEQIRTMLPPDADPAALPAPGTLLVGTLLATLTVGLLVTSVATFGEEFGWTGYLLPKLLPLGRWRAAVLYGAIWGLWHAPVVWGGYNYPGYPWIGIGMMGLFTISAALIQTGLWLRSGSVLLTSFFHASINSQARGIWMLLVVGVPPLLGGVAGAVGIAVLALVGIATLATAPGVTEAHVTAGPREASH